MNASTPFRLEAPASSHLTRLDCGDEDKLLDAEHQFRRCVTAADFAAWAATWGEPLLMRARRGHLEITRQNSNTKKLAR